MRNFWSAIALAAVLAGAAEAQSRDRYGNPYYRGDRGDRGGYGYGADYGRDVVRRVLADLDRSASVRWVDGHERNHFEQARKDLRRFEENAARGRFDRDRLDGAIGHLSHLVESRQVNPRDRQILARGLSDLREFRARGGYGGYNGRGGPSW